MGQDRIIEAVCDDAQRRVFERWMREQGPVASQPIAHKANPVYPDSFWRAVEGIFTRLDCARKLLAGLPEELEPRAPDLAFHVATALESLQPLMREAEARAELRATLTRIAIRGDQDAPTQAPHGLQNHGPTPETLADYESARKHVLTHNALAQLLSAANK